MPGSGAAAQAQAPLTTAFWRATVVAVLVTTSGAIGVFFVAALAVQIQADLQIRVSHIGLLVSLFFVVSTLTSQSAGRAVERVGAEPSMRVATILAALSLVVGALAGSWAWLGVALVIAGLANAVGQVAANLYVARFVDPSRQAFAFGIKQSGIPAATLLGGLAVPAIALTIGWRWAFALGAVLAVVVALVVPRENRATRGQGLRRRKDRDVHTHPLVVLGVGAALGAAAVNALGAFFVDSSVAGGVDPALAGLLFAAGSAFGLATRVLAGWAADRRSSGRLLWVAGLLAVGAIGYGLLATGALWLLVPATILCFMGGWGWPGLFNFAVVTRNPAAPAAATGITQSGAYAGGAIGPALFGVVAERSSYAVAWTVAALAMVVAALAILLGRNLLLKVGLPSHPSDELFG